jgi:uracil-DNA glycosylase
MKECAPTWHDLILKQMPDIEMILLIGTYAQKYYL